VSDGHRERADVFLRAARFLHEQGGSEAMLRALGDPAPVNEAWELPLEDFKEFLRQRCREALAPERGAA
jgi:hypothetical protein